MISRLELFNGRVIEIPAGFVDDFHKNHPPSYMSKRMLEIESEAPFTKFCMRLHCLAETQKQIHGCYHSYLDILGGTGITAKIFETCIDHTFVNDLDPFSQELLKINFEPANVTGYDLFKFPWDRTYDTIFIDYNDFTLKKFLGDYKDPTTEVFQHARKFVIINDCSVFYLRYGESSFKTYSELLGETVTNYGEYFLALKNFYERHFPFWELFNVEAAPETSYLLFARASEGYTTQETRDLPRVRHHKASDLKPGYPVTRIYKGGLDELFA